MPVGKASLTNMSVPASTTSLSVQGSVWVPDVTRRQSQSSIWPGPSRPPWCLWTRRRARQGTPESPWGRKAGEEAAAGRPGRSCVSEWRELAFSRKGLKRGTASVTNPSGAAASTRWACPPPLPAEAFFVFLGTRLHLFGDALSGIVK